MKITRGACHRETAQQVWAGAGVNAGAGSVGGASAATTTNGSGGCEHGWVCAAASGWARATVSMGGVRRLQKRVGLGSRKH